MAGGVVTTGNIPRLLQDGLNKIFGQEYNDHATEYTQIFDTESSQKNFELDQQMEGYGLAAVKPEGQDIEFDSQSQGFTPQYQHLTIAKGFIITKEALADERYGVFKKRARALAKGFTQFKEITGANILNNGFDSNFLMPGGDGVELFSQLNLNGPSGGTFQNELTVAADLSEASLEDMLILISNARDPRKLRIALRPLRLVIPTALAFEATRILNSILQNDTANNAINAIRDMGALPGGVAVNHYLTDTDAWFVKTDVMDGMKYMTRQSIEYGEDNAFTSGNSRQKGDERYSFGWTDKRGMFGSQGA